MNDQLIQRYQPGGDLFAAYAERYGHGHASNIAAAARTGDRYAVTDAISNAKYGAPADDSFWSNLGDQIVTDPLGAPLESANRVLGNTFFSFLKNPWVILAIATALALWLVGPEKLRKIFNL